MCELFIRQLNKYLGTQTEIGYFHTWLSSQNLGPSNNFKASNLVSHLEKRSGGSTSASAVVSVL